MPYLSTYVRQYKKVLIVKHHISIACFQRSSKALSCPTVVLRPPTFGCLCTFPSSRDCKGQWRPRPRQLPVMASASSFLRLHSAARGSLAFSLSLSLSLCVCVSLSPSFFFQKKTCSHRRIWMLSLCCNQLLVFTFPTPCVTLVRSVPLFLHSPISKMSRWLSVIFEVPDSFKAGTPNSMMLSQN